MSTARVKEYLRRWNRDGDVLEMDISTATVPLAAAALGVEPGRIAKSITFRNGETGLMVVAAGDARIDNRRFKIQFGFSPRMLSADEALNCTGFAVGGICPLALPEELPVYLDESLRRFATVFPACGSANSAIEVTPDELHEYARSRGWVAVCTY